MRIPALRGLRLLAVAVSAAVLLVPTAGAAAAPTRDPRHGGDSTVRHDITFVAMLLPHHQTAVEMATVAREKATSAEVRRLAAHIADEQSRQIAQMREWLRDRGAQPKPPPAPVREMERQDIQMLRDAQGAEVDRMFLMMMRPHHAQAISEAEDELEHGRNQFAINLARTTKVDQSRELALMNDLLEALA